MGPVTDNRFSTTQAVSNSVPDVCKGGMPQGQSVKDLQGGII